MCSLTVQGSKSKNQGVSRIGSFWRLWERNACLSLGDTLLPAILVIPWLVPAQLQPLLSSLRVSPHDLLIRKQGTELRAHSIHYHLILSILSAKMLFLNQVRKTLFLSKVTWGSRWTQICGEAIQSSMTPQSLKFLDCIWKPIS